MSASDPYPVLKLMQSHLEGRLRSGEKRLWLTLEAADALREIVRMKPRPRPALPVTAAPVAAPAPVAVEKVVSLRTEPDLPMEPGIKPEEHPQRLVLPDAVRSGTMDLAKESRLAAVRAKAELGTAARALGTLRDRMVFGTGSTEAEIVMVGGAPGAEEEAAGEPFAGSSGMLLGKILKAMGLERSKVYLTLLCKYRPKPEAGESGERNLTAEEGASCLEFVKEEIAVIRPRVVVLLGDIPFAGLLGRWGGVMQGRGKFYDLNGIPVMATLDPSYLQEREADGPEAANAEKRKLWEDMLMVMEKLDLPISPKQRGFFLIK
jgi:DNA polymerase